MVQKVLEVSHKRKPRETVSMRKRSFTPSNENSNAKAAVDEACEVEGEHAACRAGVSERVSGLRPFSRVDVMDFCSPAQMTCP